MNVPGEPLLSPLALARSLFAAGIRRRRPGLVTFKLGRDALSAVSSALPPGTVLVPAFTCAEALEGLRATGRDILFYPVGPDLNPDWPALSDLLSRYRAGEGGRPAAVLIVHYFGFMSDSARAGRLASQHGAAILEDCAHLPFPSSTTSSGAPDRYAIYSFRKQYPVASGAALAAGGEALSGIRTSSAWPGLIPTVRALTAWAVFKSGSARLREWLAPALSDERGLKASPRAITPSAAWLARKVVAREGSAANLGATMSARRTNYAALMQMLDSVERITPFFGELPPDTVPWGFPLRVSGGRENRDELLNVLLREGIGAWSWPDLPEKVTEADFPLEYRLASETLLLPLHQDLNDSHMRYVADTVSAWALAHT